MISKNYKFEKKWRKRKVKEYSKGIYVKFKPEDLTSCTLRKCFEK